MKFRVNEYLIGVDEAGRGPLAGPVAIGTSCISKTNSKKVFSLLKKHGLNDSKQVKEKTREELYELLIQLKKEKLLDFEVSLISADIISKKGIVYAINLGIKKNLKKIYKNTEEVILELDGALKVPSGDWKKASIIIKGDSIKPSIMIASIVAKVTRDRYMKKISKKYPQYQFEIHKGYGTKKHRELIKKHRLSKEHRVGWCKV
jgi:ribonuclease HII